MLVKCRLQKYSDKREPPFTFITVGEFEFEESKDGEIRASRLITETDKAGFVFKFYSLSSAQGYLYDVTVRGKNDGSYNSY